MSDFKAKMHQIRFRLGQSPRPRWGAYSAPPDPLAGFEGPTSKGGRGGKRGADKRGGEGGEGRGGREEGRGGEERGGEGGEGRGREAFLVMWPRRLSALNPPLNPHYLEMCKEKFSMIFASYFS